jgi:hypothetical protein
VQDADRCSVRLQFRDACNHDHLIHRVENRVAQVSVKIRRAFPVEA